MRQDSPRPTPLRLAVLALAAGLVAGPAAAFLASNDLVVRATGPDSFTVPWRGLSGAPDFWCAAGDYVIRGLGLPPGTRVFRASPPKRGQGEGIDFTLDPARATEPGLVIFGSPDKGLSAAHAQEFCETIWRRRD